MNINGTATSLNASNGGTNTTCLNGATSWGALIDSANRIITLTSPTSAASYVWVATGVPITISIGSSATFQGTGTHWITNATSAGTKSITIGGSFGGTGSIDVAINQATQLSATIAETLTFTINGTGPVSFIQNANNGGVTNGSTMSVQLTNPATAGNLLVVSADWNGTHVYISAVTDSLGNAYASVATTTINLNLSLMVTA